MLSRASVVPSNSVFNEIARVEEKMVKKKKARRTSVVLTQQAQNEDAQYEEFDLKEGRFIPLGTAQNARWIHVDDEEMLPDT